MANQYIVSKFGGSSVANAQQIQKVANILYTNANRKYIVVSAPGTDAANKEKVTDSLINIATNGVHLQKKGITAGESFEYVIRRFQTITQDLQIKADDILRDLQNDLRRNVDEKKKADFYASRGEHYLAKVFARYLQNRGMNAQLALPEHIGMLVTNDFGNAKLLPESYKNLESSLVNQTGITIIPGYYGITTTGDIAVFSRGGSDLTGGELATALQASLYENWTDQDGVFEVHPKFIPHARVISELTYKEIRILSTNGFSIFHYDAMLGCRNANIPINIRNTNNPAKKGTLVTKNRTTHQPVTGIARLDDMAYIYLEKDLIDEELGFTNELLTIFKELNIATHTYPSDKDDIAVIVDQQQLKGKEDELTRRIQASLRPRVIEIKNDISLIVPVGVGMQNMYGVLAQATNALAKERISIELANQSPSQLSFTLGVNRRHADTALNALYKTFFRY